MSQTTVGRTARDIAGPEWAAVVDSSREGYGVYVYGPGGGDGDAVQEHAGVGAAQEQVPPVAPSETSTYPIAR